MISRTPFFQRMGPLLIALQWSCYALTAHGLSTGSTPFNLTSYFNNQAFGTYPGESSFDTQNQSYPAPNAAPDSIYTSSTGIAYYAPSYRGLSTPDNVLCTGQTLTLSTPSSYFAISVLHASDVRKQTVLGNLAFTYADNSTSTAELRSEPWWAFLTINRGEIVYPSFYTRNDTNWNTSHVFEFEAGLVPGKELVSVQLPDTRNATEGRIHIFAMTFWGVGDDLSIPGLGVQNVRPTQKWVGDTHKAQVIEVIVNNAGNECVHGEGMQVSLSGPNLSVLEPGHVKRLCPGDQKRVNVAVSGNGTIDVDTHITYKNSTSTQTFNNVTFGLTAWTNETSNLARHESPQWFDDAKFGIFIHWGVYSVPGWGNSTPYESYAEWFWWYTTHRAADKSGFYEYRLRTFGPELNYDDFFPEFTAANYEPKKWVDLIADAGAKYFVVTTKHHDGFSLFNAGTTTNRTSLHYGSSSDLVGELFEAAREFQPQLKRGTYFSLPEWFNPDWGKYGFAQYDRPDGTTHPGIIARNPYTNETEPYTGRIPVDDFIEDIMVPQMNILAHKYESDIMWCDAGASNGTADFASRWWNWAREQGRAVTINSRCGTAKVNDFDTPEYATFATAQRQKWESNRGMDPYSYGYNRATPDVEYMNATTIITTLIDMVSKNGNLLLNIGPRADGSIPQVEIDNLREAGKWLKANEEAIFNTTYWFQKAEVRNNKTNVRFTQTSDAFYILSLDKPLGRRIEIEAPVPILHGDKVSLLGIKDEDEELEWEMNEGILTIKFEKEMIAKVSHSWVFKITYGH